MTTDEMGSLLKTYQETVATIFQKFGIAEDYGDIDDKTNEKWDYSEDSVCWLDSEGELYVEDIMRGPLKFQNFRLFYIRDSMGNKFYQIYDIENRDEEINW